MIHTRTVKLINRLNKIKMLKLKFIKRFNLWIIGIPFYIGTIGLILKSMNLWQSFNENAFKILGVVLCVSLFLFIALFYIYRYNASVIKHPRKLLLLCVISLCTLLIAYGILSSKLSSYSIPAALVGILFTSLIGGAGAIAYITVLGGLLGFISSFRIDVVFAFVIVGAVASLGVSLINKRRDLFKVGLLAGVMGIVFIAGWGWLQEWNIKTILIQSSYGMGSALVSAFLALEILPFLENLFGEITDVKLLELSHLTHPLLVILREKAKGTYQSSLMVANLAEAAAGKINANPFLARVGAYYHDIGKIKNPSYFVENLDINSKSKHEKINPALSSLILTSHVKEGVQLAVKYKLPKEIQDIIRQHHGNTFTSFFYQEALKKSPNNSVDEETFHYPGPKPQGKEAAIVMLADTVEAASHTLENPSPARIRNLVEKLIKEKLMGKQLDESQLTFNDLNVIQESFIQTLMGAFHSRIKYPEKEVENENKPANTQ